MSEVDANLYEFLKESETGFVKEDCGVVLYVHVHFYELDDFVKIVGEHHFEEGGVDVLMFDETICFELNDVIKGAGHKITSYKNCFDEFEFNRYEKELLEREAQCK